MPQTRQLSAIMFTDIVGYTSLMGDDEEKAFALLNENRRLQKPLIEKYNGRWIKELGDGVMASFGTATDAVLCASEIQNACTTIDGLTLRIGIHLGEVVKENDDLFGDGVNIAARLQSIAAIGSIWISDSVQKNISNKNAIHTKFVRAEALKHVKEPVLIYEVVLNGALKSMPAEPVAVQKAPTIKTIAVLPFTDMSAAKDQEYLGDGLAEELLNLLSQQVKELKVIGRTSSFSFKNKNVDLQTIGKSLQANLILEGSVQKSGNRIRITAQLINAADSHHIWSQRYDREIDDIFALQDDICSKITSHLKMTLVGSAELREDKKPTNNLQAYEFLLQGKFLLQKKGEGLEKALEYFQQAIDLDPEYADAYYFLGRTYQHFGIWRLVYSGFEKAQVLADKALQIDPEHVPALLLKASVHFWYEWDWDKAETTFQKAKKYPAYHHSSQDFNVELFYRAFVFNQFDDAIEELLKKLGSDPHNTGHLIELGMLQVYGRRYEAGREVLRHLLQQDPNVSEAYRMIARSYFFEHNYEEALKMAQKAYDLAQGKGLVALSLMEILAAMGKDEEVLQIAKKFQNTSGLPALIHMLSNIYLKNFDAAFAWIEQAFIDRDYWMVTLKYIPDWDPIRHDPRFAAILERMSFPQ